MPQPWMTAAARACDGEAAPGPWTATVFSDDPSAAERWRETLGRLDVSPRVVATRSVPFGDATSDARTDQVCLVDLRHGLESGRLRTLHRSARRSALLIGFADAPERAVDAFEIPCHGFYLGPPEPGSLRECLRAAARRRLERAAGPEGPRGSGESPSRVLLRSRGRLLLLAPDEIDWIVADRNYVVFQTQSVRHRVRGTLGQWATKLGGRRFVRIDRSTIVQVDRLQGLHRAENGRAYLLFPGGRRLPASAVQLEVVLGRLLASGAPGLRSERDLRAG